MKSKPFQASIDRYCFALGCIDDVQKGNYLDGIVSCKQSHCLLDFNLLTEEP